MRFRKYAYPILFLGLIVIRISAASAQDMYSDREIRCISEAVYQNECGGSQAALISWNAGETFPSLGIGHFIWTHAERNEKFRSSFPALIKHMIHRGVEIPLNLRFIMNESPPWKNREAFERDRQSDLVADLREFLIRTMDIQAEFILERTLQFVSLVNENKLLLEDDSVKKALNELIQTEQGRYALMDYVNFKGEGLSASETYRGRGWGAVQVLGRMNAFNDPDPVKRFAMSASIVLKERVDNSGRYEIESKWLPGWVSRVMSYPDYECHPVHQKVHEHYL